MNEDDFLLGKQREKPARTGPYTAKDFQLEVLGQLAEMQALTQSLQESFQSRLREDHDHNRLLRFDGRTLVAIGAIALSLTGYVLQDARNTTRRDAEIETTKARVTRAEEIAAINTEGRIRTEIQLIELREGLAEIKHMIEGRNGGTKKGPQQK